MLKGIRNLQLDGQEIKNKKSEGTNEKSFDEDILSEKPENKKVEVVSVGSCRIELTSYVEKLPKPGEKIEGTDFRYDYGGKGAYQCFQAARLGAECGMVAVVGLDYFGQTMVKYFTDFGVNADNIRVTNRAITGMSTITVAEDGQTSTVIIPGANRLCDEDDIVPAVQMICDAKVLMCQLETPAEVAFTALRLAHTQKVFTIFNPAPPPDPNPKYEIDEIEPDLYKYTHLLCANAFEATEMTGVKVCDVETAKAASKWYLEKGVESVIITLGDKGSVLTSEEYDGVHVPALQDVEFRDATGAGDSFIGAIAYFKARMPSLDMLEIVRRATEVAASTVRGQGGIRTFPFSSQFPSEFLGREVSSKGMLF